MSGPLDRPVIILGAPRSCSTLLFQTLSGSAALCSIGDESHAIFEGHPRLSPGRGRVDSNRLLAEHLDPVLARSIRERFLAQLRDCEGNAPHAGMRLLEKTPKNCLRIPFLDALFPDALYVYLYRDPLRNISSIMDAWRSGRFVTYRRLPTAHGPWSLLLPPGWREMANRPLEEIATFQWNAANRHVIDDLSGLPGDRWMAMNAQELLDAPSQAMSRIAAFIGIDVDARWQAELERPLPHSRYTLSAPAGDKWQRNAAELLRMWPRVATTIAAINGFVGGQSRSLDESPPAGAPSTAPDVVSATAPAMAVASRNQPCPCGSGKRFKACHGMLA